ncbi:hypothetical protein [uncultured Paraglaciecola sp.]|uniref:hypothetical protein n=1 Tax=uncultured Paraglaciecola sp. TaxID=1765024 RepID=UPI002609D315|nr:hypothetical protein [uncultured Paraglaciecola sp.]
MSKAIYEFNWDVGRGYNLDGLFIAEASDIESLIGSEVYFGEVCGKHSEVVVEIERSHFTVKTEDQDFIAKFEEIMGHGTISGHNPLDYCDPDEEE